MRNHRLKTNKAGDKVGADLLDTPGKHCDGGGLYLQVAQPGQASWIFRHKTKWGSIGSANVYTIAEARDTAKALWIAAGKGNDPFALLKTMRGQPEKAAGKTFAEAMTDYLAAKSPHWSASDRARNLRRYEFLFGQVPAFVALPLKAIDQEAKNKALANWNGRNKIQKDVGYYIGAVIYHAETGKLRGIKAGAVEHHEAMGYAAVPAFYARLRDLGTVDAKALQWTILTGARTDEVIGAEAKAPATWGEITDIDGQPTWVIPGNRMKNKNTHRVPLSAAAVALLGKRRANDVPLFKATSARALLATLKANDGNGFTVHGFRTTLQAWILATTQYGSDLADMCIAHETRSSVRKAYQRSDLLEQRRPLMQAWSDYLTTVK